MRVRFEIKSVRNPNFRTYMYHVLRSSLNQIVRTANLRISIAAVTSEFYRGASRQKKSGQAIAAARGFAGQHQ